MIARRGDRLWSTAPGVDSAPGVPPIWCVAEMLNFPQLVLGRVLIALASLGLAAAFLASLAVIFGQS